MRKPRMITFDIFGTLFRAEEVASLGLMEEIIRRNGLSLKPEELAQLWWDTSYKVVHRDFVTVREAAGEALSMLLREVGSKEDPTPYTNQLLENWARTELYPEAPAALRRLEDFTLGVVSNIDDELLSVLLERSQMEDRFEFLVTSEACRAYKPDPRVFHEALERGRCTPGEALHIGDTPVDDVLGPKRVGMMAGWVNRRGESMKGRIPRPEFEVRDLQEAASLILGEPKT